MCKFCLLEMESGRRILLNNLITNHLPQPLCPWIWDFEYEYNPDFDLGIGNWISDGDKDDLLFGNCISDGDNDDSLMLFHEIGRQQELQNGYWTLQAALFSWVT